MSALAVSVATRRRRPTRTLGAAAVYVTGAIAAALFAAPLATVLLNSFKTPVEASGDASDVFSTHVVGRELLHAGDEPRWSGPLGRQQRHSSRSAR